MAVTEPNYAVAAIVVLGARTKRSTCVAAIAACISGIYLLGGCLIGGTSIVAGSEPPAAGSPSTSGAVDSTVDEYLVLPAELRLDGYGARANLLVQRVEDGRVGEQVKPLRVEVADPAVAEIVDGQVVARGNGQTQVVVTLESQHRDRPPSSFQVPVRVYRASQPMDVEFVAHVESILSKRGCNSGACHGALAGKGGLRLSLRGYDPVADHFAITRQDRGRRIEPAEPGRSLLLTKPTGVVPHKGGVRLESDSSDFQLLARWIAKGFPGPKADQAVLEEIEVLPAEVRLAVGQRQQIVVRAHYGDGRIEDVTQWAKFSSADETVARVDADGKVSVVGHGRGAVVAWFASRIALARITVPYQQKVVDEEYAFAPQNLIDEILWEEWKTLRLSPSPPCSDATFLRRACLDATGRLPTAEEVADFLADPAPDKRQRLVDHLLASEGFVDYWSYKWSDLLLINGTLLRPDAVKAFYGWVRAQVEQNTPWDHMVRRIILARGDSLADGATNFYAIHQTPEAMTENVCQAFMGLSISCAKCHNHPLEKWTNDQYYAMANLFARVRAKGWGGDSRNGDGKRTLVVLDRGDLIQPRTGRAPLPAPLDAAPIDPDAPGDRRQYLAEWLVSPDNPYFARAIVNRVWANFFGVGLVEPVDDLRASNPASSPRLLDALAAYLIDHDYDLKALMRLMMNSAVYQLSSEPLPSNEADHRFYCRYYPRRLMAEVLHDAVVSVTEVPTKFTHIEYPGADRRAIDFYPVGTRAIELYDSAVANYFLQTFGRHQRRITCECERSNEPTVVQALHLNNGDTLNQKLADPQCRITRWLEHDLALEQVVDQAYVRCLSRWPDPQERHRVLAEMEQAERAQVPRRQLYEDLLWSLMTSREFLFAH